MELTSALQRLFATMYAEYGEVPDKIVVSKTLLRKILLQLGEVGALSVSYAFGNSKIEITTEETTNA